ncbi:hypothetical protein F4803DRAFT_571775 [Xylaria telfairii]|nr:hypothetical protein F4803DRAFT_571775 [Xylaria telfairii]
MNALATASRRTISDYGLVRIGFSINRQDMEFMEPYINPLVSVDPAWVGFTIKNEANAICSICAVSTSLDAYVTTSSFLTLGEAIGANRITPMRLREMIIDTYLAAGGNLTTLQFLATKAIVNKVTRDQAKLLFSRVGRDITQKGSVEVRSWDEDFAVSTLGNPFTRCIHSLLQHHKREMGDAKIEKFIFLSEGLSPGKMPDDTHPILNLVIQLCRPGCYTYNNC